MELGELSEPLPADDNVHINVHSYTKMDHEQRGESGETI